MILTQHISDHICQLKSGVVLIISLTPWSKNSGDFSAVCRNSVTHDDAWKCWCTVCRQSLKINIALYLKSSHLIEQTGLWLHPMLDPNDLHVSVYLKIHFNPKIVCMLLAKPEYNQSCIHLLRFAVTFMFHTNASGDQQQRQQEASLTRTSGFHTALLWMTTVIISTAILLHRSDLITSRITVSEMQAGS